MQCKSGLIPKENSIVKTLKLPYARLRPVVRPVIRRSTWFYMEHTSTIYIYGGDGTPGDACGYTILIGCGKCHS